MRLYSWYGRHHGWISSDVTIKYTKIIALPRIQGTFHASIRSGRYPRSLHYYSPHRDIFTARRFVSTAQRGADQTALGESVQWTGRSHRKGRGCPVRGEARVARGDGSACGVVAVRYVDRRRGPDGHWIIYFQWGVF